MKTLLVWACVLLMVCSCYDEEKGEKLEQRVNKINLRVDSLARVTKRNNETPLKSDKYVLIDERGAIHLPGCLALEFGAKDYFTSYAVSYTLKNSLTKARIDTLKFCSCCIKPNIYEDLLRRAK